MTDSVGNAIVGKGPFFKIDGNLVNSLPTTKAYFFSNGLLIRSDCNDLNSCLEKRSAFLTSLKNVLPTMFGPTILCITIAFFASTSFLLSAN